MNYEKLMLIKENGIFADNSSQKNSYQLISEYFYNVLSSDKYDYKVIIDDETSKLIQIFKEIFENFEEEIPNHEKFQLRGKFIKLEDINNIKSPNRVLIVNTILNDNEFDKNILAINQIKKNNIDFDNFGIWTHLMLEQNPTYKQYEKYLLHFRYATYDEIYALIHTLSQFISGYNILKKGETLNYELHSGNSFEEKYLNRNELLNKLGMESSSVIFVDIDNKINKQYGIYSGIKEYDNKSKELRLIIPFVLIPNIKTDNIYNYFNCIFKEIDEKMPIESDEFKLYNKCIDILKRKVVNNFKNNLSNHKKALSEDKDAYLNIESIRLISDNLNHDNYVDLNELIKKASYKSQININEFIATLIRLIDSNKLILKNIIDDEAKFALKKGNEFFHIPYEYMCEEADMFLRLFLLNYEARYSVLEEFAYRLNEKYKTKKFTEFLEMKDLTCGTDARITDYEIYRMLGINRMPNYSMNYNPNDVENTVSEMCQENQKILSKHI